MVVLKIRQSWANVGTMPLFRALILDGATYYFVLALTSSLNIVATMNSEVGALHSVVPSTLYLIIEYSSTIPSWTPSMPRCVAVTSRPNSTNSFIICVNVVACNHLMLSLMEAGRRHTSMERPSYSLPRLTTSSIFAPQAPDITNTQSRTLPLSQPRWPTDSNHEQNNLEQNLGTLHEMQPVHDSTVSRVSLEMD